jgi:hypothetical protein
MAAVTSGQGVLIPAKQRKERRVTVAVNSRDRNIGANYNSNEFRWSFRRPLKDVTAIELVNGCVPADLYNVQSTWGSFSFGEDTGARVWNVTLTPGQYNATELCAELQIRLNTLPGILNTYTVVYSSISKKATITGTGTSSFTFYFQTGRYVDEIDTHTGAIQSMNCAGQLLGFEYQDETSVGGILIPPHRMDPFGPIGKVYLHINADNSIEINRIERGAGRRDCFHILYMDQIMEGYYSMHKDIHAPIFYSSPAPIARIATLNISIRDEFYRLVDLGNHDYTLLFEITYLD